MPLLKPDPTFYPSPRLAAQGPPEKLAYVAALNPPGSKHNDAMIVVDVDPASADYGQEVGRCTLPNFGDELHHFGWNACSSALCPYAPHPHIERRYLVVPGIRSSRIYIIDTKPDPREAQDRADRSSRRKWPRAPAIRAPTPCIAGRKESTSAHSGALRRWPRRHFPARSLHLRCARAVGGRPGRRNICTTISGGICSTTPSLPANGARPT